MITVSLDADALEKIIERAVQKALGERQEPGGKARLSVAARARGISAAWIRGEQDARRLATFHAGRVRLVDLSELDALLAKAPGHEATPRELARASNNVVKIPRAK